MAWALALTSHLRRRREFRASGEGLVVRCDRRTDGRNRRGCAPSGWASYARRHLEDVGKGWSRRSADNEAKGVAWALVPIHQLGRVPQGTGKESTPPPPPPKSRPPAPASVRPPRPAAARADQSPTPDQIAGWCWAGCWPPGVVAAIPSSGRHPQAARRCLCGEAEAERS